MLEKKERNRNIYEYHLRCPELSYKELGEIFKYKDKDNTLKPLDAAHVFRIVKRYKKMALTINT